MIAAAIVDIDGTRIDSVEGHAQGWTAAFKEFGFDVDQAFAEHRGGGIEGHRTDGRGQSRVRQRYASRRQGGYLGSGRRPLTVKSGLQR
jgi:beta-phosphoglucomutase-like phosphatase (HAD superfamily)